MNQNKKPLYKLFIKPILKSKSKRFYYIFKPKEIVVTQPYELSLYVANLGEKKFPGGIVNSFFIKEGSAKREIELEIKIPSIGKNEFVTTDTVQCKAVDEGVAWITLKVKTKDKEKIEYCQFDRATNRYTSIGTDDWHDYFHISSLQEIHQRFTNYLLIILTIVMILLMVLPSLFPSFIDLIKNIF